MPETDDLKLKLQRKRLIHTKAHVTY